jgi:hypothetical protein
VILFRLHIKVKVKDEEKTQLCMCNGAGGGGDILNGAFKKSGSKSTFIRGRSAAPPFFGNWILILNAKSRSGVGIQNILLYMDPEF